MTSVPEPLHLRGAAQTRRTNRTGKRPFWESPGAGLLLLTLFWTLPALAAATSVHERLVAQNPDASWWLSFLPQLLAWYPWIGISALVVRYSPRLHSSLSISELVRPLLGAAAIITLIVIYMVALELSWQRGFLALAELPQILTGLSPQQVFPYLTTLGLVALAAQLYFHFQRYREQGQLLDQIRLQSLKAQLRPHFLFNTLNAISGIVQDEPAKAREMIADLSDLLRASLEKPGHQEVELREELRLLGYYLNLEQARFSDRLELEILIEPEAQSAMVPHLLLQPLVENAIRHGISRSGSPGFVRIRAARSGDRLTVVIENSGPLLSPENVREGVGLSNTRARLERLYSNRFCFELNGPPTGGCQVRLEIPFTTAAETSRGK